MGVRYAARIFGIDFAPSKHEWLQIAQVKFLIFRSLNVEIDLLPPVIRGSGGFLARLRISFVWPPLPTMTTRRLDYPRGHLLPVLWRPPKLQAGPPSIKLIDKLHEL